MRAVVLHEPGVLKVESVPDAVLPPGGLLIEPSAVGICGSDVRTWRHGSPRLTGPQVLGHELAGTIMASDVPDLPPGAPVAVCPGAPCGTCRYCRAAHHNLCRRRRVLGYDIPGGMAEAVAIPADWIRAGCVVQLGPRVDVRHGAVAEPLHTVFNGQDQARVEAADSVLILGLGPIGVLHAATARSLGSMTVVGADPEPGRVSMARELVDGLDAIRIEDGWEARARAATEDGEGFDVVIVATGVRPALASAMDLVAPNGRVLAFAGFPPGAAGFEVDMNRLHYGQLSLLGSFGGTPRTFRRAVEWLSTTGFPVASFTTTRFPLESAIEAFEAVERGDGLKTLLEIGASTGGPSASLSVPV